MIKSEFHIEHATLDDAAALNLLVNSAYRGDESRKGWTTEADLLNGTRIDEAGIADNIRRPETIILKYILKNEILGCVELDKMGTHLYLGMLCVKPYLQNSGIGKILMEASEQEAIRQACDSIILTAISIRSELIEWYKRRGYVDTGKRTPFDFDDPRFGIPKLKMEFIVMEKKL